jgi:hypothetical protein
MAMSTLIVNYALNGNTVSNPDGTMPATASGCTVVGGPGATTIGSFDQALSFGPGAKLQVALTPALLNFQKFCVRTVIKVDAPVTGRQNLVEANVLPFSLFLDKAGSTGDFRAVVSVAPTAHGWSGTTTDYAIDLKLGNWYTLDLIYDTDTVAVAVNGLVQSVHAFPNGALTHGTNNTLFVGTWVDGVHHPFQGSMAAVQVYNDIPLELETQLDERRSSPEWFVSYKYEQIRPTLNFGQVKGKLAYDFQAEAYVQLYDSGLIMFNEGMGTAFEMHGIIFQSYTAMTNKSVLGHLISDEGNAGKPGSRKSLFRKGGIYWSSGTGAVLVTGQIYIDYELVGEAAALGLPVSAQTNVPGGLEQVFQGARMYHKSGQPKAHEVHGAILTKYLASGSVGAWGFPTSNESDVRRDGAVIGKFNDFEACTIYWSGATGAFEVHGDIREKYRGINGPLGALGFPTSDEAAIPGAPAPARHNTFQNGSILWFGSASSTMVCYPFQIFLGRIDSQESEGAFMGQNDLYLNAIVEDNHHEVMRKRFPNSGDFGGHNVIDINQMLPITVVPNSASRIIDLTVDVWESDNGAPFGGGDDHLGVYKHTLNMANAWGLRENQGIFNSGKFSKINCITWSVKPKVNEAALSETQKWWGVKNQGTATISKAQYAAAFRDVDSEPEWWDLTDWLEKAFYELVVSGVASGGNCFGMSLEGIYARKQRSIFSLPIDRFTTWATVVNEFNIKHQYQVGAEAIWWFVGQFLSGNSHDPVDVFKTTRDCFNRSDNPVLCLSQNADFSGAPHCLMPVGWDSSAKPWKLHICDPNFPGQVRDILIDPDANTFSYDGGSNKYSGGEWSGGRLHYMPYCVLDDRPRTPIWDALALLLAGTVLILGSDATTQSLVDENGNDLDAFGADAIARRKQGKPLDNKFVSFKGFHTGSASALASEMFLRTVPESKFLVVRPGVLDNRLASNLTVAELTQGNRLSPSAVDALASSQVFNQIRGRDLKAVLSDTSLLSKIDPAVVNSLNNLNQLGALGKNLRHVVKGHNNGMLKYAIKSKMNQLLISTAIQNGELSTVSSNDLGTSSAVTELKVANSKLVRLEIENKLGVGKDKVKIVLDKIPADVAHNLQINVKPGMAGLDIITAGAGAMADVSVQTLIDGRLNTSNFAVKLDAGTRLRPSSVLTSNELKVGRVDNLFGQLRGSTSIKAK